MSAYEDMVAWYRAMRKKQEEEAVAAQQEKANRDEDYGIVFTYHNLYGNPVVRYWPADAEKPKVEKLDTGRVRFVAYTGKYPNLCNGELFLIVNGKKWFFHYNIKEPCVSNGVHVAHSFWKSGGDCYGDDCVTKGLWKIDMLEVPDELSLLSDEIYRLMNANIPHGCCGGCL